MKLIFPTILIIISGVALFIYTIPTINEVSSLRNDISTYKIALADSKDLQQINDNLFESYKNVPTPYREKLEKLLPNTVNNIKFILEIEQIANSYNMPIRDIKFDPKKAEAEKDTNTKGVMAVADKNKVLPYGVFPIEFTTEGTYESFVLFIKDLEKNLRVADVKSISFSSVDSNKKTGAFTNNHIFMVKLETYWLK